MDYQLIIFLSKKEIMAIDITEDGCCEEISINGNSSMSYDSVEDFADFKEYICDAYNVDEIEDMNAGATLVNCDADFDTVIALMEELREFQNIDSIDVKKLLPIVAQNKSLLEKNNKILLSLMGNCYAIRTDAEGVATTSKNKPSNNAVELTGEDFGFLYFYKGESSGASEEELNELKDELLLVKQDADKRISEAEKKNSELAVKIASLERELSITRQKLGDCHKKKSSIKRKIRYFEGSWPVDECCTMSALKEKFPNVYYCIRRVCSDEQIIHGGDLVYYAMSNFNMQIVLKTAFQQVEIKLPEGYPDVKYYMLVSDFVRVNLGDPIAIETEPGDNFVDAMEWYKEQMASRQTQKQNAQQ